MNQPVETMAEKERVRRRNGRNWAVFLFLLAFVILIYGVTIVRIKEGMGP